MSAVPIDISYQNSRIRPQFHRDSFAHSQGMGGISWGGVGVGSWLRDEIMLNNMTVPPHAIAASPPDQGPSYFPTLEADFCKDYLCCGTTLPTLHDLLRHYEESHIPQSPLIEPPVMRRMQNLEMVSTNEVFLSHAVDPSANGGGAQQQQGVAGTQSPLACVGISGSGQPAVDGTGAPPSIAPSAIRPTLSSIPPHNSHHLRKDDDGEPCIDDPARHLYVIERNNNSKPYKCPVIGCDKTYKNQNGLKYHRLHGHQNQTLHLNEDGSYSIIDPLSNAPYPDGMDLERDKPYRCEICGKRYKNLNGLKYHRAHSTH